MPPPPLPRSDSPSGDSGGKTLADLAAAAKGAAGGLSASSATSAAAMASLGTASKAVAAGLTGGASAAGTTLAELAGFAKSLGSGFGSAGSQMLQLNGNMIQLSGAASSVGDTLMTITGGAIVAQFQQMGNLLGQFVGALNPAAVELFQFTMRDLSAVVGVALMPVFSALTEAARNVADTLLPLARQMAPVLGTLAQTMAGALMPVFNVLVEVVRATLPTIQMFADHMRQLTPVLQMMGAFFQALTQTIGSALGQFLAGALGGPMDQLRNAFRTVAQAAIMVAAYWYRMLAMMPNTLGNMSKDMLKNLSEVLGRMGNPEKANSTGQAAAMNAQVQDVQAYMKSQLAAAFIASSAMSKDEEEKTRREEEAAMWKGLKESFDKIAKMDDSEYKKQVKELFKEVISAVRQVAKEVAGEVFDAGKAKLQQNLRSALGGTPAGAALSGSQHAANSVAVGIDYLRR